MVKQMIQVSTLRRLSYDDTPLSRDEREKFQQFYYWMSRRFPRGYYADNNMTPVNIDSCEFQIIMHEPEYQATVTVCLHLKDCRYARKQLVVHEAGWCLEDESGRVPDFDLADPEPIFVSSNTEILSRVIDALYQRFGQNPKKGNG